MWGREQAAYGKDMMQHFLLASVAAEEPAGLSLVCWQPQGAAVGPARLWVYYFADFFM